MRNVFIAFALLATPACGKKDPSPAVDATVVAEKPGMACEGMGCDKMMGGDHKMGDHKMGDHAAGEHDHAAGKHVHTAPHGGEVQTIGAYHIEAVPTKAGLLFFPLDGDEKELPLEGVTGKLTFVSQGKEPAEVALEPMGNHLHGMVVLDGPWKAVVNVTIKGEAFSARFEGSGIRTNGMGAAGDDHDHDHGAMAMPGMKLSETVEGKVSSEPIVAGAATALKIQFERKDSHAAITDFEVTHEQKLHVFVVSEDMSFFAHVHPDLTDATTGAWTLPFTFPQAGKYRLYADFKSTAQGPTVTSSTIEVPGTAPAPQPLVADTAMTKTFEGLKVTIATMPTTLGVGDAIITYTIADAATGAPVTDLQPYLGAMAHLFILNQDLTSMAHAHPRGPEVGADSRGGPTVELHANLPKTGLYKLWAQFQRGGKIITTDWVLEAK